MYSREEDENAKYATVIFYDMDNGTKQYKDVRDLVKNCGEVVGIFDYKDEVFEVTWKIVWYQFDSEPKIVQKIRHKGWRKS